MNMRPSWASGPKNKDVSQLEDLSRSYPDAKAATRHALALLEASLTHKRYSPSPNTWRYHELRRDLPYVIHEVDLPDTWILVNREYKPVGSNMRSRDGFAVYEDYPNLHVHMTRKQLVALRFLGSGRALFSGSCTPWNSRSDAKAYIVRLNRLLKAIE